MAGPLPFEGFRWATREYLDEVEEMMSYDQIKPGHYRVDLEYPKKLDDAHNAFPLAVESLTMGGVKKLVPNLYDKHRYVIHHEVLKFYLKHGMVLKKVHEAVLYTEKPYMRPFIEICTKARKVAKNDFEKDIFKLAANANFGKLMENVRNRSTVEILNGNDAGDREKLLKRIAKPNYEDSVLFDNSQLVSVKMRRSAVKLNKPIYHGVTVLDRAKLPMYAWHYDYVAPKYGNKAELGYTDTDWFIYEIKTEDIYEDIRADVPTMFDTHAFPEDHPSRLPRGNKKVPGLMKDEACGRNITKVRCLGPKQYAYEIEGQDQEKKCKGVRAPVVKGSLTLDHYEKCLESDTTYYARFNNLRSRKHDVTTECITKVALTSADNKRVIIPNDPEHRTLAPGHWRTKDPDLYNVDINIEKLTEKGSLMDIAFGAIQ